MGEKSRCITHQPLTLSCSDRVVAGVKTSKLAAFAFDLFPFTARRSTGDRHAEGATSFAASAFNARISVGFVQGALWNPIPSPVDTAVLSRAVFIHSAAAAVVGLGTFCNTINTTNMSCNCFSAEQRRSVRAGRVVFKGQNPRNFRSLALAFAIVCQNKAFTPHLFGNSVGLPQWDYPNCI